LNSIRQIRLGARNLDEVRAFYCETLGFQPLVCHEQSVAFEVGDGTVVFDSNKEQGQYHFAFNVEYGRLTELYALFAARLRVIPVGDDAFARFDNWKARAFYFLDPAGNIVEFIERAELGRQGDRRGIVGIGEIGLATEDVSTTSEELRKYFGLSTFRGTSSSDFEAIGDENALLIVVREGRVWFPTEDEKASRASVEFTWIDRLGQELKFATAQ